MDKPWHEPLVLVFLGGPYDGKKKTHTGLMAWPLPKFIMPLGDDGGTYYKARESTMSEQTQDSRVVRGAEYDWKQNG